MENTNLVVQETERMFYPESAVEAWIFEGIPCFIRKIEFYTGIVHHYAGYAVIIGMKETNYFGMDIHVHGGVTYAEKMENVDAVVIGFDCAHWGDDNSAQTRDIAWLKKETETMAIQAKKMLPENVG